MECSYCNKTCTTNHDLKCPKNHIKTRKFSKVKIPIIPITLHDNLKYPQIPINLLVK